MNDMINEITMTIKQAIAEGYTLVGNEESTYCGDLLQLTDDFIEESEPLYLATKETHGFSGFTGDEIFELLADRLDGQEEVNNEDDHLHKQLEAVDFEAIATTINAAFTRQYHELTDIRLIKEA